MTKAYYPVLSKLKGRIREENSSYRALSRELGMALATFSRKINGCGSSFDLLEAESICNLLEIKADEIPDLFYPRLCSYYTKKKKNTCRGAKPN